MKINRRLMAVCLVVTLIGVVASIFIWPRQFLPGATMEDLVQLPRPNSSTYTTQQAERRKVEIFSLRPTARLSDWVDPEFGTGFCVHITRHDTVEVEHFSMQFESDRERLIRDGLERFTGERFIENPSHHYNRVTLTELEGMASLATMFNQPAFVVVTSERPATQSKVFPQVLDCLFRPAIMLHYVPETKRIEQDSGGKGDQRP